MVFNDSARSERGVEGRALLVVEIRSPGDEAFEKVEFCERVGVREVLVIDRDSKSLRRWAHSSDDRLREIVADRRAHALRALPMTLRSAGGRLVVSARGRDSVI